jgi:hypothetical protein
VKGTRRAEGRSSCPFPPLSASLLHPQPPRILTTSDVFRRSRGIGRVSCEYCLYKVGGIGAVCPTTTTHCWRHCRLESTVPRPLFSPRQSLIHLQFLALTISILLSQTWTTTSTSPPIRIPSNRSRIWITASLPHIWPHFTTTRGPYRYTPCPINMLMLILLHIHLCLPPSTWT